MKVTKYPQSCLVLCKNGQCILIDPGNLVAEKYKLQDLGLVEAVLYTHSHPDHFDESIIDQLKAADVEIYANADVASKIKIPVTTVKDGEEFLVAGFKVKALDLPHFPLVGTGLPVELPQNTGYLIDGLLFHPGDGLKLSGLKADNLAAPIGSSLPDPLQAAIDLADGIQAEKIIPIHYEGHFKPSLDEFIEKAGKDRVIDLKNGDSVEL